MAEMANTKIRIVLGFTLSARHPMKQEKRRAIPSEDPFREVARSLALSWPSVSLE